MEDGTTRINRIRGKSLGKQLPTGFEEMGNRQQSMADMPQEAGKLASVVHFLTCFHSQTLRREVRGSFWRN